MIVGTIRKGFSINPSPPLSLSLFFFYLSGYLYRSVFLYLSRLNLCSPPLSFFLRPPHPQPLLQAQMLFRSPEGRVELKSLRDRSFAALMPVMPRRVAALSTRERTLVISQPRYWASSPPSPRNLPLFIPLVRKTGPRVCFREPDVSRD